MPTPVTVEYSNGADTRTCPGARDEELLWFDYVAEGGKILRFWVLLGEGAMLSRRPWPFPHVEWVVHLVESARRAGTPELWRVVDREIDILVEPNLQTYRVIDLDDFGRAIAHGEIPPVQAARVLTEAQQFLDKYLHGGNRFPPAPIALAESQQSTLVDPLELTRQYYARWTGVTAEVLDRDGLTAVPSVERDVALPGYSAPCKLYCFVKGRAVVVSYSPSLSDRLDSVLGVFKSTSDAGEAAKLLCVLFPSVGHCIKFRFDRMPDDIDTGAAVQLRRDHYGDFLRFFTTQHPHASPEGWLEAYFGSLVDRGYAFGVFQDGRLVAATDAPDMPYMSDVVVEIGINTLEAYRRRGYAKVVVTALLRHLLSAGKVPLWSCASNNDASRRLALSVGFRELADVLTAAP